MFTGIVTGIGIVRSVVPRGDVRIEIETSLAIDDLEIGASVACSGACLTVVGKGEDRFAVDVSRETLSRTTLGEWTAGTRINLERSLAAGDELGGHLVSGHVDAVGRAVSVEPEGASVRLIFDAPSDIAPFIAGKGAIAVDGVSLTVNEVSDADDGCRFGINIIPHTQDVTTLGALRPGQPVNLEIDMLARYMHRMLQLRHGT